MKHMNKRNEIKLEIFNRLKKHFKNTDIYFNYLHKFDMRMKYPFISIVTNKEESEPFHPDGYNRRFYVSLVLYNAYVPKIGDWEKLDDLCAEIENVLEDYPNIRLVDYSYDASNNTAENMHEVGVLSYVAEYKTFKKYDDDESSNLNKMKMEIQ